MINKHNNLDNWLNTIKKIANLFGVAHENTSFTKNKIKILAFCSLLARRLILIKWKAPLPEKLCTILSWRKLGIQSEGLLGHFIISGNLFKILWREWKQTIWHCKRKKEGNIIHLLYVVCLFIYCYYLFMDAWSCIVSFCLCLVFEGWGVGFCISLFFLYNLETIKKLDKKKVIIQK